MKPGTGVETRERTQVGNGDGRGDKYKDSSRDGNRNGRGSEDRSGDENGNDNGDGRAGGEELWDPSHQEWSREEDQALPFCTQHHVCRQEMTPGTGGCSSRLVEPLHVPGSCQH